MRSFRTLARGYREVWHFIFFPRRRFTLLPCIILGFFPGLRAGPSRLCV